MLKLKFKSQAAAILASGYGYSGVYIMCACVALTGLLIYTSMYIRLRQAVPCSDPGRKSLMGMRQLSVQPCVKCREMLFKPV